MFLNSNDVSELLILTNYVLSLLFSKGLCPNKCGKYQFEFSIHLIFQRGCKLFSVNVQELQKFKKAWELYGNQKQSHPPPGLQILTLNTALHVFKLKVDLLCFFSHTLTTFFSV